MRPLTRFIPEAQLFESLQRQTGSQADWGVGKILQERASQVSFDRMCEAESVVFLRSILGHQERFIPVTLPYWSRRVFEMFRRSWGTPDEAGMLTVLGGTSRETVEGSVKDWMSRYVELVQQWAFNHDLDLLEVWGLRNQPQPQWRNW